MYNGSMKPAAGYSFNNMQEIKSHSAILYNERLAILFYMLDLESINLNRDFKVENVMYVRALLKQIYKNIRTLIRNNPVMRVTLNLETKDPGIYVPDVTLGYIDKMIEYCETTFFTAKRVFIIANELNNAEMLIKDILQYYNYFIRPDFRQKPDVDVATETYKEIADKRTLAELREIVGKKNFIDFENLGSSRIDINPELGYNDETDDSESETYEHTRDFIDTTNEREDKKHFDQKDTENYDKVGD